MALFLVLTNYTKFKLSASFSFYVIKKMAEDKFHLILSMFSSPFLSAVVLKYLTQIKASS